MSLFDNNLVSTKSSHTQQEWETIIYNEMFKRFREHLAANMWFSYDPVDELGTDYWIEPQYKDRKVFKKYIRNWTRLPKWVEEIIDQTCNDMFGIYGVIVKYEVVRENRVRRIKKLKFRIV